MKPYFNLSLMVPSGLVLSGPCISACVRLGGGYATILANHISTVSLLQAGIIEIEMEANSSEKASKQVFFCYGGFFEFLDNSCNILADKLCDVKELDPKASEAELQALKTKLKGLQESKELLSGGQQLEKATEEVMFTRQQIQLREAILEASENR